MDISDSARLKLCDTVEKKSTFPPWLFAKVTGSKEM